MIYDEYEKSRFATWTWISSFCVLPERTFAFRHACCCCWLTDAWKRASTVIRAPFIRLIHTQCSSIIVVRFDSICLSCNQQKKDTTKRSNRKNYSDSNSSKRKRGNVYYLFCSHISRLRSFIAGIFTDFFHSPWVICKLLSAASER